MMTSKLHGVIATPVTAMDGNQEVDASGIARVVDFVAGKGVEGLFCLGSWGGFALMNHHERKVAAKSYLDAASKNNIPCVINVAATTAKEAIDLALHAQENGAYAIASLVPYYYSSNSYDDGHVIRYFEELIDAVDVPVHLYNNPRSTGFSLNMQLFDRLLGAGLKGMKEGSGSPSLFIEMMNYIDEKEIEFEMIPGSVTMMPIALIYGVKAVMIGSAVVFPELAVDTWRSWGNSDLKNFKEGHSRLMKLRKIQSNFGMGASSCYSLLKVRGVEVGSPRNPWIGLTDEQLKKTVRDIRKIGIDGV